MYYTMSHLPLLLFGFMVGSEAISSLQQLDFQDINFIINSNQSKIQWKNNSPRTELIHTTESLHTTNFQEQQDTDQISSSNVKVRSTTRWTAIITITGVIVVMTVGGIFYGCKKSNLRTVYKRLKERGLPLDNLRSSEQPIC